MRRIRSVLGQPNLHLLGFVSHKISIIRLNLFFSVVYMSKYSFYSFELFTAIIHTIWSIPCVITHYRKGKRFTLAYSLGLRMIIYTINTLYKVVSG